MIVADRFTTIFRCFYLGQQRCFFVIRHKENLKFETLQERELPPKGAQNILKDEDIILSNPISKEKYPKKLRRVAVWDDKTSKPSKLSPIISLGQLPPLQNCTNKGGRLRFFQRHQTIASYQNIYRNI